MANTCDSMAEGVMEWSRKGMHFVGSKAKAGEPFLQEEQHDLEALYSHARAVHPAGEQVRQLAEQLVLQPHCSTAAQQTEQLRLLQIRDRICERGAFLGAGHMVVTSSYGTDEECERELQKEAEEEEENERQVGWHQGGGVHKRVPC